MAAINKDELGRIAQREFGNLMKIVADLDEAVAMAKDEDDTSIKDVIAHRAHWIDLLLGWYADGQDGKEVHFPAKGYKWNELKRYNAELRKQQANLGWAEAISLLDMKHQTLMTFINRHSDQDLYGGPMKGAKNDWTPGRWAEAAGPSHYRSAAKYLRMRLRNA